MRQVKLALDDAISSYDPLFGLCLRTETGDDMVAMLDADQRVLAVTLESTSLSQSFMPLWLGMLQKQAVEMVQGLEIVPEKIA